MTWRNRFRMFFGLIFVVVLVAGLTLVMSQRKGETTSESASVVAEAYPVGTDYPGAVVEQFVEEGDQVAVGDPIAKVQSNALMQDLDDGVDVATSDVYDVSSDGTLTVKSSVNGVIDSIDVRQGGYAAAGSTIATVWSTDKLYVEAEYLLDPTDYGRIEKGALVSVDLPDTQRVEGTVTSVDVTTNDGVAVTTVRVDSKSLISGDQDGLMAPGTPVVATLQLRNDDALARLIADVKGWARGAISTATRWLS
ncbi:MAG: biotin attachment protein [Schumannella sp.]|nr:biotin attachment protein [Schumannella sp.]